MLTVPEVLSIVPRQHKSKITQEFVDTLNGMVKDPTMAEVYQKNVITYADVLRDGRFKLTDYFNAVMYVSYKMMGLGNLAAYQKVFPDKCKDMVARNMPQKDMQAYAAMFNKNKLVTLIYEQTLIPDHIMYASVRHRAIAAQANLLNSSNEHVVQKAADSLMNHLKAPESAKISIEMGAKDSGVLSDLTNALNVLSRKQSDAIAVGSHSVKEIAHSRIIEGELNEE